MPRDPNTATVASVLEPAPEPEVLVALTQLLGFLDDAYGAVHSMFDAVLSAIERQPASSPLIAALRPVIEVGGTALKKIGEVEKALRPAFDRLLRSFDASAARQALEALEELVALIEGLPADALSPGQRARVAELRHVGAASSPGESCFS